MIDMEILTPTCAVDVPNLYLQAHSLDKFWKGKKKWSIIVDHSEYDARLTKELIESKLSSMIMNGWNIQVVVPEANYSRGGWWIQQLYKMHFSATAASEWMLILDAKNFLIKDCSEVDFIGSRVLRNVGDANEFNEECKRGACKLLNIDADSISSFFTPMTPWVWKTKDIAILMKELDFDLDRFVELGDTATEYSLFWCKFGKDYHWKEEWIVAGCWPGSSSLDQITEIRNDVRTNDRIKFWTHHRKVTDFRLRRLTAELLLEVGFDNIEIKSWLNSYENIYRNQLYVINSVIPLDLKK